MQAVAIAGGARSVGMRRQLPSEDTTAAAVTSVDGGECRLARLFAGGKTKTEDD